jgi:hypothetical protein
MSGLALLLAGCLVVIVGIVVWGVVALVVASLIIQAVD